MFPSLESLMRGEEAGTGATTNRVGIMFLEVSILTLSFASLSFVCWYCCSKRRGGKKPIPLVEQALIPPAVPPPVETIDQAAFDDIEADIQEEDTSTQASTRNDDEEEEEYTPIKGQKGSFRTTPSPRRPSSSRRLGSLLEEPSALSPPSAVTAQPKWKVKRKEEQSRARQSEISKRRAAVQEPV